MYNSCISKEKEEVSMLNITNYQYKSDSYESARIDQGLDSSKSSQNLDRLWRHTGGRASCAARTPVYTAAMGILGAKIALKSAALPIASVFAWATNTKKPESLSLEGIAKDSLMLAKYADKTGASALGVIFAPPEEYYSLDEAVVNTIEMVILGDYHIDRVEKETEKGVHKGCPQFVTVSTTVDQVLEHVITRPNYSELIVDAHASTQLGANGRYIKAC